MNRRNEIIIAGAGPAGTLAALFLAREGVPSTVLEKKRFPRDKICGDGMSGWVLTVLNELDPQLTERLLRQPWVLHSHGIRIVSPNHTHLDLPFLPDEKLPGLPPGFLARRLYFDNFLAEELRRSPLIDFFEETEVTRFEHNNDGVVLTTHSGKSFSGKLAILATGFGSRFMEHPGNIKKDDASTMTAVKTYFEGVTGFHEGNYVELHFLEPFLPGYFWVFPIAGGLANVGAGIDRKRLREKRLNLKQAVLQTIGSTPYLRERFSKARQVSAWEADGLPLWDRPGRVSGDGFLLAGDNANLVDPVTGEGMGHAAVSGMLAARQAIRSIQQNRFDAEFNHQYDDELEAKIGKELRISRRIPGFIRYPWLMNGVISRAAKSRTLQQRLALAMTDLEVRKRLKDPLLYLKILAGG